MIVVFIASIGFKYTGPPVNFQLNNETCPRDVIKNSKGGYVKKIGNADYSVLPGECDRASSAVSWTAGHDNLNPCSCRNGPVGWAGFPILGQNEQFNKCEPVQAAYTWLYGQPQEGFPWLTIPYQQNYTIAANLNGFSFDPDGVNDSNDLSCGNITLIKRLNFCFYNISDTGALLDVVIPISQKAFDETTDLCNNISQSSSFYVECCSYYEVEGGHNRSYVNRPIYYAAACDMKTRDHRNADGKYHTGAETNWGRNQFKSKHEDRIVKEIKDLISNKTRYDPSLVRTSPSEPGFNGVSYSFSGSFSAKTVTLSAGDRNDITDLTASCIVPRKALDAKKETYEDVHFDDFDFLKRWALHTLLSSGDSLKNGDKDFMNPSVHGRATISRDYKYQTFHAWATQMDKTSANVVRDYVTNGRGAFPNLYYNNYAKDTPPYTVKAPTDKNTANTAYFQMCPVDYAKRGGSFLPSYQYFYQPGKDEKYWEYNDGKWEQYKYSDHPQYSQFSPNTIDCKLAGNVSFISYTDPDPQGQYFNFRLNCSDKDPKWRQMFTDILNAKETAGKLTPQTRLREGDPLNIATVSNPSTPVTPSIDQSNLYHKRRLGFKHPSVYGTEQTDDLYPSGPADKKLPDSASRIAKFYFKNFDGDIYEGQTYQIESAVISCPTCLKHNHNGAASLFPDAPVLGTRPRIDDLVGSDFVDVTVKAKFSVGTDTATCKGDCKCKYGCRGFRPDTDCGYLCGTANCGSTKCFNPETATQFFQSTCKDPSSFQGGKTDYLDVNAEKICAVTEFQECFIAEPTNSTSKSKSSDFFMGLNQYGTGSSTQFSLMGTSMNQKLFNNQPGFERKICSYYGSPIKHGVKDTCDPRKYDPIVPNPTSPQACSNARVRFRKRSDYAVWPEVPDGKTISSFNKSLTFNDAPTMIFVSGQNSGYDVDKEAVIFKQNMKKTRANYPWYSLLGDLAPNYTSFFWPFGGGPNNIQNTNISLPPSKMTGNDCYQCTDPKNLYFFDCYGNATDLVYPSPSCDPSLGKGFCKIEQLTCTSPGSEGKTNSFSPCIPPRTENTDVPCGFLWQDSNCYDNRRPTAAGPCPQENDVAKTGGWWKNPLSGLGPVRIGESNTYTLLFRETIDIEIGTESFIKKLYSDPSNLDGDYASIPFVSIKNKFYFPDKNVDEVYADGTFDFCSNVSTAFNDTIQNFQNQGLKIGVYTSKLRSKNINTTLLSRDVQTCIGNLHGFPQSSPGICVGNENVEQLAGNLSSSTDKRCDSPGSALPQCGNPAFFVNKTKTLFPPNPSTLHGSVYAHYCLKTDGSPFVKNPKKNRELKNTTENSFVECDEDVFSPTDRQTFCSTDGIGAGFGGIGIQASRVPISGRKDEFVCSNEGGGCIAFAADSAYPLQKVIDLGQKTFGTTGFTVFVIPVNISVMNNMPLGPLFYDMTKQNGFFKPQSDLRVPNEFKVFDGDKTSKIESAFCDGGYSFVDAKQELVDLIESMRQTSTGECPGYKTGICPKDSYCVPSLEATPSMAHVSCVSREEMFPPIFDSDIEVRVPNVIIQPLWGKPSEPPELDFDADMVRFGPLDGKSPSCVRVKVTAPNVILNKMFFDQTACLGLEESKMVPIVVSGSSAVDSAFTNIVMVGHPSAAVVVTGNRNDGDAPFIDVAGSKVAAVKQIITADANPKEGIIVAFARTMGDHLIQQCEEVDNPSLPDPCSFANTNIEGCSSRGCPTQRCGTHNYTGLTKAILKEKNSGFIIVPVDVTARPKNNIIVTKAFDGNALLEEDGDNICYDAVSQGTLKSIDCDDINAKFWVTSQQIKRIYYRLELENRPFTAVYINDTDYSSLYLLPAHGCDVTEVDSVLECDQDNAGQANAIKKGPVPSNNSIILGQDFFVGEFYYVEIDVKTGACGSIKNCRPECFRPTEELCDLDEKTGITEYICRFEIAKRGAIASVKISGGPSCSAYGSFVAIVQPGSNGDATLKCDGNLKIWILDNPGTNYTSGPATSGDGVLELVVGVAEALIQPYDSSMVQTVVFGSVNLINVSEFTNIFGKAFENVIFASSTSRGYYISAAAGCVVVATILTILAVHRIVRRNTIGKNIKQD